MINTINNINAAKRVYESASPVVRVPVDEEFPQILAEAMETENSREPVETPPAVPDAPESANSMPTADSTTPTPTVPIDVMPSAPTESQVMNAINTAGASNDSELASVAMMMMCMMMMQSGGMNSGGMGGGMGGMGLDMTPLMLAMVSMLGNLSADSHKNVRSSLLSSGLPSEVTGLVDSLLFNPNGGVTIPDVAPGGNAIIPTEAWKPCSPSLTSSVGMRSAQLYRDVISQFRVETSERYRPRDGNTYCNIFVWDVTAAMGAEIPHFVDYGTGAPRTYPDVSGAMELDANGTLDWLVKTGPQYGWREVTAQEAQAWANSGRPAVTAWKNVGGIGHVQVVSPSNNGAYDPVRGVAVAQAGASLYDYAYISSTYSASRLGGVQYFIHE